MFVEIQVKNNPFVKVSPTTKYFKLLEKSDTKVHFKILSKCSDVPYSDTFALEEDWLAISPHPNANCCMLRIMSQVIFYKSTIFKSKIQSSSVKGSNDVWAEWAEWIRKRGIVFKEKKPPQIGNKLKHGIEKSSKLFEKKNEGPSEESKHAQQKTLGAKLSGVVRKAQYYVWEFRVEILLMIIIIQLATVQYRISNCS